MVSITGCGMPLYSVRGNHDAEPRGPFTTPPALPDLHVVERGDVRFVLLDNHDGLITADLFRRLEAKLAAHLGRRNHRGDARASVHQPDTGGLRLRAALPFDTDNPVMRDAGQVARFTELMDRYGVLAVLAGHIHRFDRTTLGATEYIVTGAAAGPTPGLGIPNEYLDITIDRHVSPGEDAW